MADTYVILEADSAEQLADRVNKAIEQGWLPNGGIYAASTGILGCYKWYQPMIEQTAAMQVLGTAVETYKTKPVFPADTFKEVQTIHVIGCPLCENQSRSNTSYLQAHDIYILHLQLDHKLKTPEGITPAFSYSGTEEGFHSSENSPTFDHYHACPSCNMRLGCNDNEGHPGLYCWLGLEKMLGGDPCDTVPGILEHKCAPRAKAVIAYSRAKDQCGFVAIDDEIYFCDLEKGHGIGHSLRKTKIQGWT